MKPPYAIGSVPSLSGHATAYRWRLLRRVRQHRASKPQGSSERVLPWQVTMDQLIFASLSHTHYWYEVGMLKVPAYQCEWHRMTRMTGSDCVVICNSIYIHTHTRTNIGAQRKRPDYRMTPYNRALEITGRESIATTLRLRKIVVGGDPHSNERRGRIDCVQIQPEYGDGHADAGRDCRTRLARPNSNFPVQLTTCRTDNLTRLIHTLATCVTIHSDVRAFGMAGDLKATVTALQAGVWVETVTEGERRVYGRVKERRGRRG